MFINTHILRFITALVLNSVVAIASSTPMTKELKGDFVKSFVPSCLVKQRQNPLSKYMTESQLNEYCYCGANRSTDFISIEDLGRMLKTKNLEHIRPHVEAAGNYCKQVLMKKWGYSN